MVTDDRNDDGDGGNADETDGHDYGDYEGTVVSLLLLNNQCFHVIGALLFIKHTHAHIYKHT